MSIWLWVWVVVCEVEKERTKGTYDGWFGIVSKIGIANGKNLPFKMGNNKQTTVTGKKSSSRHIHTYTHTERDTHIHTYKHAHLYYVARTKIGVDGGGGGCMHLKVLCIYENIKS